MLALPTEKVTGIVSGEFGAPGEVTTTLPEYEPVVRLAAEAVTVNVAGLDMPLEATVSHGELLAAEKTIPDVPEVNCTV